MEGEGGSPVVRPSAPLDRAPSGLYVGTAPWLSALPFGRVPCRATLQIDIPSEGAANACSYDLSGTSHCGGNPYASFGEEGIAGLLMKDTVWSAEILVTGTAQVPSGISLTIEPGTVIRLEHCRGYTEVGGLLDRVQGSNAARPGLLHD